MKDLYSLSGYLPRKHRSKRCAKDIEIPTTDSKCVTTPNAAKLKTPYKLREYLTLQDPPVRNASFILESKVPPQGAPHSDSVDHEKLSAGRVVTRSQKRQINESNNTKSVSNENEEQTKKKKMDKNLDNKVSADERGSKQRNADEELRASMESNSASLISPQLSELSTFVLLSNLILGIVA